MFGRQPASLRLASSSTATERAKAKAQADKEKARAKKIADRERAAARKAAEKEKAQIQRERLRARKEKEAEAERARKKRERERARKLKEREKAAAARAKVEAARALKRSKPKRAATPYALFLKENYGRIAAANPSYSISDVARAIAAEWRVTPQHHKDELARECAEDRQRWLREVDEWKKSQPPKRPKSAYLLFCDKHRAEATAQAPAGSGVTQVARILGAMWKQAPEFEKRQFQDQADVLMSDWQAQMSRDE